MNARSPLFCGVLLLIPAVATPASAAEEESSNQLTEQQQRTLDRSVDNALIWLATQQKPDGSFQSLDFAQPGVTGLCVLAYLTRGHLPGQGLYGESLRRAIAFIRTCQQPNGLITHIPPPPNMSPHSASHSAIYNHGIGGLALAETYGQLDPAESARMREVIQQGIAFTKSWQQAPKQHEADRGGWRYVRSWDQLDSDLSVTSWQLMFLRSARNAGFDVPPECIEEAMKYVERGFDADQQTFIYGLIEPLRMTTRAMAGAGILSLSLAGKHDTDMARTAGNWLLRYPFTRYNDGTWPSARFHYGAFYCSQAMFQLGGKYWSGTFPALFETLAMNQSPEGSWQPEHGGDEIYGNAYTTALAVLALSPPYQLLPILQR